MKEGRRKSDRESEKEREIIKSDRTIGSMAQREKWSCGNIIEETDRQTDTHRQIDIQIDRHTGRHTHRQTHR